MDFRAGNRLFFDHCAILMIEIMKSTINQTTCTIMITSITQSSKTIQVKEYGFVNSLGFGILQILLPHFDDPVPTAREDHGWIQGVPHRRNRRPAVVGLVLLQNLLHLPVPKEDPTRSISTH